MKSIYIASVERYSGKTAVCLGLGKRLQASGYRVGYLKPLSLQPWMVSGHIADEDAGFVKETLGLAAPAWELSPVVLTADTLRERLAAVSDINLMDQVKAASQKAGEDQDVLLLEGGATLREGYVVGLPTVAVAEALGSRVLMIVKYRDDVRLLDDALASRTRLGGSLAGILINRMPNSAAGFVANTAAPFLEKHGIPVFGALPESRGLAALTVGELIEVLGAEVLTKRYKKDALVENLTIGAMTTDAALRHFRQNRQQAVITGGDRTDIQLAALETSTACLILTGNLRPSPLVVRQAEEFGIAVLLVNTTTMETVERIEAVFGRTRLGQPAKLAQFQSLLDQHLDFDRLLQIMELHK